MGRGSWCLEIFLL